MADSSVRSRIQRPVVNPVEIGAVKEHSSPSSAALTPEERLRREAAAFSSPPPTSAPAASARQDAKLQEWNAIENRLKELVAHLRGELTAVKPLLGELKETSANTKQEFENVIETTRGEVEQNVERCQKVVQHCVQTASEVEQQIDAVREHRDHALASMQSKAMELIEQANDLESACAERLASARQEVEQVVAGGRKQFEQMLAAGQKTVEQQVGTYIARATRELHTATANLKQELTAIVGQLQMQMQNLVATAQADARSIPEELRNEVGLVVSEEFHKHQQQMVELLAVHRQETRQQLNDQREWVKRFAKGQIEADQPPANPVPDLYLPTGVEALAQEMDRVMRGGSPVSPELAGADHALYTLLGELVREKQAALDIATRRAMDQIRAAGDDAATRVQGSVEAIQTRVQEIEAKTAARVGSIKSQVDDELSRLAQQVESFPANLLKAEPSPNQKGMSAPLAPGDGGASLSYNAAIQGITLKDRHEPHRPEASSRQVV